MINWRKTMWKKDCSHFPHIWVEKIHVRWIPEKIKEHLEQLYKANLQMRHFHGPHCAGEHYLTASVCGNYTSDKSHSWWYGIRFLSVLRLCHLTKGIREPGLHSGVPTPPVFLLDCQETTSVSPLRWQHESEDHWTRAFFRQRPVLQRS